MWLEKWEDAGLLKGPQAKEKHVKPLVGNFIFLNVKNLDYNISYCIKTLLKAVHAHWV